MTTSNTSKRRDKIEAQLPPKDWAIKYADGLRKYPSPKDMVKPPPEELWRIQKEASAAFKKQAEEKYPGSKPEDKSGGYQYYRGLHMEFDFLRLLPLKIYEYINDSNMKTGLKAALNLARLEMIILQDAFRQTARKAAEWIELVKTVDADDEENRQIMLKELAAPIYTEVDLGEKWSDSVPLPGGVRVRFPSAIEAWIETVTELALTVYAERQAVQIIQDKYFDGHPILFQKAETEMNETIQTLEGGIETFNAYLKSRSELFKAEWEEEEQEGDGITSAIPGELEGRLTINVENIRRGSKRMAEIVVAEWLKEAKFKAKINAANSIAERENITKTRFTDRDWA